MSKAPTKSGRSKASMTTSLRDLFRRYAIPSPLHKAVQEAARQEGWTPPWDRYGRHEEHRKNKMAGETSGLVRGWRASLRRTLVQAAHRQLKPTSYQRQPFSEDSIDALQRAYRNFLAAGDALVESGGPLVEDGDDFVSLIPSLLAGLPKPHRQALKKVSRETLKKDLKGLRIRSKHRQQRSG